MFSELNFKSGKPAFLQIVDQIKFAAAMGDLKSGDPLPSIRALAEKLRINRNTVAKAYNELEHEGIVETSPGKGVYIKNCPSPFSPETRNAMVSKVVDAAIVQAHHLQVNREELLNLFIQRYEEFEKRRNRGG